MWYQETTASKKRLPRIHTELVRGGDIENYNRSHRGRELRKPILLAEGSRGSQLFRGDQINHNC
jgi:hypothetical protein